MLLLFPSGLPVNEDTVCCIKSLNKDDFNEQINEKVSEGWEVENMTSKYRKAFFGGSTCYEAELRRVPASK